MRYRIGHAVAILRGQPAAAEATHLGVDSV